MRPTITRFGCLMYALLLASTGVAQAERPPNFVVMIADDMGWNDSGAYGHPHIRTPNIDRLAQEGMRFDAAYLTTSSCSPSRSSLVTGRYPHNTGAGELHQPLPDDQVTVAELLQEAGYYTAAAGKWHLGRDAQDGFDRIEGGRPSGCEEWVTVLRERPRDQPFFAWLAAFDPHRPYTEDTIPQPHTAEHAVVPPFLPDVTATREDLADYYDEIARMDDYVGKVLNELDRQGIAEETMVIFLSDNGRPFPRCKTTLYDSGVKTPFLVRWSGAVPSGITTDSLVSAVDLGPTLLSAAGLDIPETMQGSSFAPLLSHPTASIREYAFSEHNWHDFNARERSVRDGRFLYIRDEFPDLPLTPPADAVRSPTYRKMLELREAGALNEAQQRTFVVPRPKEELYDMQADPYSLHNLAEDEVYQPVLEQLRGVLDAWQERTDDIPAERRPAQFDPVTGERVPRSKGAKR